MKNPRPPAHPKGHKVRDRSRVYAMMDAKTFLNLTDTPSLEDVWVQPVSAEALSPTYVMVRFKQIIAGVHMHMRVTNCKLLNDDLLRMLYLNEMLENDLYNMARVPMEEWLVDKITDMMKMHGASADASNHSALAVYILSEMKTKFYPLSGNQRVGVFFRKSCCHSYKRPETDKSPKVENPNLLKVRAPANAKKQFEFVIEARLFAVPPEWRDSEQEPIDSQVDI